MKKTNCHVFFCMKQENKKNRSLSKCEPAILPFITNETPREEKIRQMWKKRRRKSGFACNARSRKINSHLSGQAAFPEY